MIGLRSIIDARGLPARSPHNNGAVRPMRGATFAARRGRPAPAADEQRGVSEEAMRHLHMGSDDGRVDNLAVGNTDQRQGLPNRLLTAFEVASFIGCHEETVRRAYWRGLLRSQRFGVRGRRFHPEDVLDWLRRGAPTKVS
jgi:excisionase family DNA binding protein